MSHKSTSARTGPPTYEVKRVILRVSTEIMFKDAASADIEVFPFENEIILGIHWRGITDDDSMKLTRKGQLSATMTREQAMELVSGLLKSLEEKQEASK